MKGGRFKPFSLSPSTGLAAPPPLTGRRKRRAQRNTSETGERVVADAPAQETHADILKASSLAPTTVVGVGGWGLCQGPRFQGEEGGTEMERRK